MKTALITGVYGFLGRNAALMFKDKEYNVIGMGYGDRSDFDNAKCKIDHLVESAVTIETLEKIEGTIDVIVHCAGSGAVGLSFKNPAEDFESNVATTLAILEYMRLKNPGAKLIYPSSAAVYGAKNDFPIKEEDALNPMSPYGYHKKIAEELCESYSRYFDLKIAVIRLFSLYGNGLKKQLLWDACRKISSSSGAPVFWGTGSETRDWLHVNDAASLIVHIAETDYAFEIINGGSGERKEIKEILTLLIRELTGNANLMFNHIVREGDPEYYHADIAKALNKGWRPLIKLDDGVKDYVRWFKGDL